MDLAAAGRAALIGLSIAAPVGPIGALCIRRTLTEGRLAGLLTGLGAATADGCYGAIVGFGLTIVSGALLAQERWLRLVGGLFLLYLGARTLLARPASPAPGTDSPTGPTRGGLAATYASTALLTLANPLTILSFAGIFAGLGPAALRGSGGPIPTILGVFLGSALWWLFLVGLVGAIRTRLGPRALRGIGALSGLVIVAFGIVALAGLLHQG